MQKNLTRAIYMDETGTHKKAPLLVVGAVIIHADDQMSEVESRIMRLIEKYVDEPNRGSFFLHATDLFWGKAKDGKPSLPRELHDQVLRWKLLEEVLEISPQLKIPICFGATMKGHFRNNNAIAGKTEKEILIAMHAAAIAECTFACEMWNERIREVRGGLVVRREQ